MIYRHNSTIGIKEKPCKSCGKVGPIFSKGRCVQCAKVEDFNAKYSQSVSDSEDEGLPSLIATLDGIISKYVRLSAADKDRNCECYTCKDIRPWYVMDAGHYVSRTVMYLRFDISRNIRPQCHICNRSKYGMAKEFAERLEQDMPGVTDILREESLIIHKWDRSELRAMINEYTQKLKQLQLK